MVDAVPTGDCRRCRTRPATQIWAPDGMLGYTHGIYMFYCRRCVLEEQLTHARARAAEIPAMEAELKELKDAEEAL